MLLLIHLIGCGKPQNGLLYYDVMDTDDNQIYERERVKKIYGPVKYMFLQIIRWKRKNK